MVDATRGDNDQGEHPSRAALPAPLSPLVGRELLVETVQSLLQRPGIRLVTLTGPGGVGKTRLALHAAEVLRAHFAGGVRFVPLAALRDPALVIPTIARALGVREHAHRPLAEALAEALQDRQLLVLDNLEHLLAASPDIADLLARCPILTILATSRGVLRLSGEWSLPVPPLPLPLPDERSVDAVRDVAAVRLFVERAEAASSFRLTDGNAAAVVDVCRRLDGLPLALELAAARLRHLPVEELAARLEPRLPLLTGVPRNQPARLRTMRDAVAWSYDLLTPEEQRLSRRVAVFSRGFTLEAAAAVSEITDELLLLDTLGDLVDSSLIQRDATSGEARYTMLETIREYGLEALAASGEADQVAQLHASWCVSLLGRAWPSFAARIGQQPWLDRVANEHDNVRVALAWLLDRQDASAAVRLAGAMFWFWFVRGHLGEGRRWLRQVLAMPGGEDASAGDRARALLGAGVLAHFQDDDASATPLAEEAWSLARQAGFAFGTAAAPLTLGIIAEDQGDHDAAVPYIMAAVRASQVSGDRANEALALYHLGVVAWAGGNEDNAVTHWEAALAVQREIGDRWGAANSLGRLGLLLGLRGDRDRAVTLLQESLRERRDLGTPEDLANGFANLAVVAVTCDDVALAAQLFAAEETLRNRIGSRRKLPERAVYERAAATARDVLGAESFAMATRRGEELSLDQHIAAALAFAPSPSTEGSLPDRPPHDQLTPRERDVLRLLVLGRTNPEIAEELFISPSTARVHVSNILAKLDARTRTQAADLARRLGLV